MTKFKVGDLVRIKETTGIIQRAKGIESLILKIKHIHTNNLNDYLYFSLYYAEKEFIENYWTAIKERLDLGFMDVNFELVERKKIKLKDMLRE